MSFSHVETCIAVRTEKTKSSFYHHCGGRIFKETFFLDCARKNKKKGNFLQLFVKILYQKPPSFSLKVFDQIKNLNKQKQTCLAYLHLFFLRNFFFWETNLNPTFFSLEWCSYCSMFFLLRLAGLELATVSSNIKWHSLKLKALLILTGTPLPPK